ncbi:M20 family metallopeptidase [Natrialba asiatica]|uniref:Peptidase M20 n=1 Tax=Natrialba asiatica (strain ATCC 700177 / DSM 12278 / JCM 9576 / FERM P-10747 / NBRC 102637 / 172P1) TaxID=29540 RepID=M0B5F3_NATA1|nr:M20/M25/M40 family metallo-hydrolase [Natrialba asiatica]ELZ04889.1 peptidase M20 [Natrialba asiatica DSM 12278]
MPPTESIVTLTRELVSIPSHEDETEAGEFIESWLRRETDADVRRDAVGNVFARTDESGGADESETETETEIESGTGIASGSEPRTAETAEGETDDRNADTLALVGHHDVVAPAEPQTDETGSYVVREQDARLYGRGAADMKGALAAAMLAFRDNEMRRTSEAGTDTGDADPGGELVFASFVGEEIGGTGARHAIDEGFAPEFAVVGEGSTNYSGSAVTDVAVAHKGRRGSTITTRGSAAHASEVEAGENAIYRATDAIEQIRDLEPPTVTVAGETLAGTVAVTEIEGGTAMNVIPARCEFTIDERTVPGERAPLADIADRPGVEWTIEQDLPPMRCDDAAFIDAVQSAADAAQSGAPELVTKPHATDAGWLSDAGTECVIYGPAEPGEAHTDDESVSIAALERCYETYRRIAERWPQ